MTAGRKFVCHSVLVSAAVPPTGVVTFLFTDIEGSTRRWEADADDMRVSLIAHDKVLRDAIEALGVSSCAGVRRDPAFWGRDVSIHRY